jgi:hypothetical protein
MKQPKSLYFLARLLVGGRWAAITRWGETSELGEDHRRNQQKELLSEVLPSWQAGLRDAAPSGWLREPTCAGESKQRVSVVSVTCQKSDDCRVRVTGQAGPSGLTAYGGIAIDSRPRRVVSS